jgi:hypothetical protein
LDSVSNGALEANRGRHEYTPTAFFRRSSKNVLRRTSAALKVPRFSRWAAQPSKERRELVRKDRFTARFAMCSS